MKLYLVRHGETEWNSLRRVQGRTDIDLNERGIRQAKAAAAYLKDKGIGAVYSAPLRRAFDTALEIAKIAGIPNVTVLGGLTEINFGAWEGKTDEELSTHFPEHWSDWNWVLCPELCREIGAESAMEILERALDCVDAIRKENAPGAAVAAISHTMPIKLIVAHSIGLPMSRIRDIRLDNCGTSLLEIHEDGKTTLRGWNNTSYLGGIP